MAVQVKLQAAVSNPNMNIHKPVQSNTCSRQQRNTRRERELNEDHNRGKETQKGEGTVIPNKRGTVIEAAQDSEGLHHLIPKSKLADTKHKVCVDRL